MCGYTRSCRDLEGFTRLLTFCVFTTFSFGRFLESDLLKGKGTFATETLFSRSTSATLSGHEISRSARTSGVQPRRRVGSDVVKRRLLRRARFRSSRVPTQGVGEGTKSGMIGPGKVPLEVTHGVPLGTTCPNRTNRSSPS